MFLANAGNIGEFLDGFHGLRALFPLQTVSPGVEIQIFVDRDVRMRGQGIGHIAHGPAGEFGFLANRNAVEQHVAGSRFLDGGNDPHGGRLARAVRAHKTEDVTGVKRERNIVHGNRLAEFFPQIFDLDFHDDFIWRLP